MSFTCPDCEAYLVSVLRALNLEEGETALLTDDGRRIVIAKVACANGCSSTNVDGDECGKDGCTRPKGHTGRHNHAKVEA